jgi:high-affinity Fe2+/Pb2+ permease
VGVKYILAGLSAIFLILATVRMSRGGATHPQSRTWLLLGVIFAAVSAWLFYQG